MFAKWSTELHSMGVVHITGIVSAILFGIFGGILAQRKVKSDKVYGITGVTFILLELMKVLFMITTGSYPLDRIPFQICTVELFFF